MTIKFSKDHEWVRVEGDVGTVGITDYAQSQLGDVVFVELPEPGRSVEQGKEAAVVESVKAASEVFSPISGEVIESYDALVDDPSLVNSSPETDGWFFRIQLKDASELDALMDEAAYKAFEEESH